MNKPSSASAMRDTETNRTEQLSDEHSAGKNRTAAATTKLDIGAQANPQSASTLRNSNPFVALTVSTDDAF